MNPRRIELLAGRWRWMLGLRDGLFALGAAGFAAGLTLCWTAAWVWLATAAFLATLAIKLAFGRLWTLDAARVVRHLDRTYPALEESSALWLRAPTSLTLLERLQLKRIDTAISRVIPEDPPPGGPPRGFLRTAAACGMGGLLLWAGMGAWTLGRGRGRGTGDCTRRPRQPCPAGARGRGLSAAG